jgi:hypothetical protein
MQAAKEAARDGGAAVAVPLLADLGYPPAGTTPFKGGETAALARMAGEMSIDSASAAAAAATLSAVSSLRSAVHGRSAAMQQGG